jgi:hypothetical protein
MSVVGVYINLCHEELANMREEIKRYDSLLEHEKDPQIRAEYVGLLHRVRDDRAKVFANATNASMIAVAIQAGVLDDETLSAIRGMVASTANAMAAEARLRLQKALDAMPVAKPVLVAPVEPMRALPGRHDMDGLELAAMGSAIALPSAVAYGAIGTLIAGPLWGAIAGGAGAIGGFVFGLLSNHL